MSSTNIILQISSFIAGFIYLKSSLGKIKNPYAFSKVIESYKFLPTNSITLASAILIGPLELTIGLLIMTNIYREEALFCGICLQLFFITLMIKRYNQVLPFGCGCFGLHGPEKITLNKLAFNILYTCILSFILLF
jgi:hypothetical protein